MGICATPGDTWKAPGGGWWDGVRPANGRPCGRSRLAGSREERDHRDRRRDFSSLDFAILDMGCRSFPSAACLTRLTKGSSPDEPGTRTQAKQKSRFAQRARPVIFPRSHVNSPLRRSTPDPVRFCFSVVFSHHKLLPQASQASFPQVDRVLTSY